MNQEHPIWKILNREGSEKLSNPLNQNDRNLAIISPNVQLSFIFHIGLFHLNRSSEKDDDDDERRIKCQSYGDVVVVGQSQVEFQENLSKENDWNLLNGSRDENMVDQLERIKFNFCPTISHLVTFLYGLTKVFNSEDDSNQKDEEGLKAKVSPIALIITNLTSYFPSSISGQPNLSDLTRVLILINSIQSFFLKSTTRKGSIDRRDGTFPIYLIDRFDHVSNNLRDQGESHLIDHHKKASKSFYDEDLLSNPNYDDEALRVIQNFFGKVWIIEKVFEDDVSKDSLKEKNDKREKDSSRFKLLKISSSSSSSSSSSLLNKRSSNEGRGRIFYKVFKKLNNDFETVDYLDSFSERRFEEDGDESNKTEVFFL